MRSLREQKNREEKDKEKFRWAIRDGEVRKFKMANQHKQLEYNEFRKNKEVTKCLFNGLIGEATANADIECIESETGVDNVDVLDGAVDYAGLCTDMAESGCMMIGNVIEIEHDGGASDHSYATCYEDEAVCGAGVSSGQIVHYIRNDGLEEVNSNVADDVENEPKKNIEQFKLVTLNCKNIKANHEYVKWLQKKFLCKDNFEIVSQNQHLFLSFYHSNLLISVFSLGNENFNQNGSSQHRSCSAGDLDSF